MRERYASTHLHVKPPPRIELFTCVGGQIDTPSRSRRWGLQGELLDRRSGEERLDHSVPDPEGSFRHVVAEGAAVGLAGTIAGLLLALPAVRFVAGLLFDTSAFDAGVFEPLLTLISMLATVVPADRGSRSARG